MSGGSGGSTAITFCLVQRQGVCSWPFRHPSGAGENRCGWRWLWTWGTCCHAQCCTYVTRFMVFGIWAFPTAPSLRKPELLRSRERKIKLLRRWGGPGQSHTHRAPSGSPVRVAGTCVLEPSPAACQGAHKQEAEQGFYPRHSDLGCSLTLSH